MCLRCDEDDGGDGFLMALTGTSLYYQERGGEKEAERALSRSTELKKTKDRST
jgi:hypothetical protein